MVNPDHRRMFLPGSLEFRSFSPLPHHQFLLRGDSLQYFECPGLYMSRRRLTDGLSDGLFPFAAGNRFPVLGDVCVKKSWGEQQERDEHTETFHGETSYSSRVIAPLHPGLARPPSPSPSIIE
jgi:hypothetical protein